MNEDDFRQHWLKDGMPFEKFEAKDLKYSVWGYYRAVLSTDNCIQAFENLSRKSFLGIGRPNYENLWFSTYGRAQASPENRGMHRSPCSSETEPTSKRSRTASAIPARA